MIPRLVGGVALGAVAFVLSALSHRFASGLEQGVLVNGAGQAVTVVGGWWVWAVGVVVLVFAFVAAAIVCRPGGIAWLGFGLTVAALAVAGSVVAVTLGPPPDDEPRPLLVTWLIDGATTPLTWAIAGVAIALAVRASRPAPETSPR